VYRALRFQAVCLGLACLALPTVARAVVSKARHPQPQPPQDTGFLNRRIELHGATYRFQVYLPEEWRRDDGKLWPIILFLHGRGERGSEGMWQTQVGIAEAVRNHPERWPFVIVMPQCPQNFHWTDPAMLELAMASLDQESTEFHGDPSRTYLTGLSMGGYGTWDMAARYAGKFAAFVPICGGIHGPASTPDASVALAKDPQVTDPYAATAARIGSTPVWIFHGDSDPVVPVEESRKMAHALQAAHGSVHYTEYPGVEHNSWDKAYAEPELVPWLLAQKLSH